ncbi:MAG: hypothetical protein CME71_05425, partial [Halobacteriovorax sp.]|nr:hypothetical protein [Halobacteriovorax sp.]
RETLQAAPLVEQAPVRETPQAAVEQVRVTREEVRMEADEVAPEVRAQNEVVGSDTEQRTSNLINTIKQAASKYEGGRPEARSTAPAQGATASRNVSNNRAKTIAERLGFINFDEEELDTPSYLRKEEASENEKQNGPSRPLDL